MDGALGAPEDVAATTTLPLLQPTPLAEHGVLAGLDEGVPAHRIVPARAPFVAEGAATGAPQAVQVADRWHLWHDLGEAAERSVAQHRGCLRVLVPEPAPRTAPEPTPPEDAAGSPWPTGHRFADRIRARHATVHALLAQRVCHWLGKRRRGQCVIGMCLGRSDHTEPAIPDSTSQTGLKCSCPTHSVCEACAAGLMTPPHSARPRRLLACPLDRRATTTGGPS